MERKNAWIYIEGMTGHEPRRKFGRKRVRLRGRMRNCTSPSRKESALA